MSVIYEVNLSIAPEIFAEFKQWLNQHITDMLALPGFESARLLNPIPLDQKSDNSWPELTVCYVLANQAALQNYFENYAEQMRDDGTKRFAQKFSATRRAFEFDPVLFNA